MSNYKTQFAQSPPYPPRFALMSVVDTKMSAGSAVRSSKTPMTQSATNFCNSRWWPRKKTMNVTTESQP
ncbi:hypothetical protein CDV36_016309 [Fusarium kuroshium]|uniref:Uncharacterized protein n=1 Tax=Fusarium kuroshium TaxID=2010991 RepID=A0A3M2QUC4_9HYPO|nr:hypothetical protein CDV36_016309 [Fusarium kuroshium]